MSHYPDHLVIQAKRLLAQGYNRKQIGELLRVNDSTVSTWCRGISNDNKWKSLIKYNELKRTDALNSEAGVLDNLEITKNLAKIFCALLYGCEGSKYPATNRLELTNSDENLIKTFVTLIRRSFVLDESKWRIHLQIHTDQDYSSLVSFWSSLLDISRNKFIKPTITSPNGKKHRNVYYGTCTVRYYDFTLQLKLIGIFEQFMRKSSRLEAQATV